MTEFVRKTRIQRSAEEVFAWHERPGALQRLSPPWATLFIESVRGGIRDGGEVRLRQKLGPLSVQWHVRHEGYVQGRAFADRQISGPFLEWVHHHEFEPVGDNACDLIDRIRYELPMESSAGKLLDGRVRRELDRAFRYRHDVTRMDLETHRLTEAERPLVIVVTGATGLIGSAVTPMLRLAGHEVRAVSRGRSGDIRWDPEAGKLDPADLEGIDGVIHLAGEPIAQRWTDAARHRILESRRKGTRLLAATAAALERPPRVFVSMSGMNAYGAVRAEPVTEESGFGGGFLAEVCREWEAATEPAEAAGIRRVIVRSGIVLSPAGGTLAKLLPVFRMGLGGPIGKGERWMSWVAIDDIAAILAQAVLDERYRGPINAVAPQAVRNREFSKALGNCLHRPAVTPVPPPVLKLGLGRMAEETILSDLRVIPRRLETLEYRFRLPDLRNALNHVLGSE